MLMFYIKFKSLRYFAEGFRVRLSAVKLVIRCGWRRRLSQNVICANYEVYATINDNHGNNKMILKSRKGAEENGRNQLLSMKEWTCVELKEILSFNQNRMWNLREAELKVNDIYRLSFYSTWRVSRSNCCHRWLQRT